MKCSLFFLGLLLLAGGGRLHSAEAEPPQWASLQELKRFTLDELLEIPVTIASRRPEPVSKTDSAVFVITGEDIRRSGATSIPEALRMAPGVQVTRIDAHTWGVSSRGFNAQFSNKQLVLIDGRTVYSPVQSGVYWDVLDVMLEDIDRIEIIRGPGGAIWGANAVNGVINIITRNSRETQGGLLTGGAGTEELGFGAARYGVRVGENLHLRMYGKYFNRDDSWLAGGGDANDHWWMGRGGMRLDWNAGERNTLMMSGELYSGQLADQIIFPSLTPPFDRPTRFHRVVGGGHLLGRWTHELSDTSEWRLQAYFDRAQRAQLYDAEDVDTYDAEFQHFFLAGERHELVWGAGYRMIEDDFGESFMIQVDPGSRQQQLFNAFIQDKMHLVPDRWTLTLGVKLEHNDYTGFELQPSLRTGLQLHEQHYLWASASRAVRTPSRVENDIRGNPQVAPGPVLVSFFGNRDLDAEELYAFELGYRFQPIARLSLDLALFYHVYDRIRTLEAGAPVFEAAPPPPHLVIPYSIRNWLQAESYGAELSTRWQAADFWRLEAACTLLQINAHLRRRSTDRFTELGLEGNSPQHQLSLRSLMDLPRRFQVDAWLRYVDGLPNLNIPSYLVGDLRLGWSTPRRWEFSLVFQNVFDSHHPESNALVLRTQRTEVEHSLYGKVTYRF